MMRDYTIYGWFTVRQMAERTHTTSQNIRAKVKKNKFESCTIDGLMYVAQVGTPPLAKQPDNIQPSSQQGLTAAEEKLKLENALKIEKLRNLQQDTLIKKQKQTFTKQKYRQEYVQGVFECFTESFANIKNLIIQLKLSKEENNKFKRIFAQCIKKFEINLKNYLHEADKKELQQNEDNQN